MPSASTNPDGARSRRAAPPLWDAERPDILDLLASAEITAIELLPRGSNYTFLARLHAGEAGESLAVYKPRRGEAPLWDFPDGTLYRRERAAYLVSRALGWPDIPPTVIRNGPEGIGTVQLYIDHDPQAHYFTFGAAFRDEMRRVALFDYVTNNADRKSGHCLLRRSDSRVWSIDHGLTFHAQYKLRTVVWDFRGEPAPPGLVADLAALADRLATADDDLVLHLRELITPQELDAFRRRIERTLAAGVFPDYGPARNTPWPPV